MVPWFTTTMDPPSPYVTVVHPIKSFPRAKLSLPPSLLPFNHVNYFHIRTRRSARRNPSHARRSRLSLLLRLRRMGPSRARKYGKVFQTRQTNQDERGTRARTGPGARYEQHSRAWSCRVFACWLCVCHALGVPRPADLLGDTTLCGPRTSWTEARYGNNATPRRRREGPRLFGYPVLPPRRYSRCSSRLGWGYRRGQP